jgi:hypothetical protein
MLVSHRFTRRRATPGTRAGSRSVGPRKRASDDIDKLEVDIDTPGHCGYHDDPPVGQPIAGKLRHLRPVVVSVASLLENGIVRAKSQCGQLRGAFRRVVQLNLSN